MHIGLVGPASFLNNVYQSLKCEFPQIQITSFPYTDLSELPGRLEGEQYQCDFFLFLGETARRWTASQLRPAVPWYSVPRSTSSLLRILAQAFRKSTPPRIVTDFQDPRFFQQAFEEADISPSEGHVEFISAGTFAAEGYMERNAALMEDALRNGRAAFCATIFSVTYDILRKKGLPVYYFLPSFEDVRHTVRELVISLELRASEESQIAVISLHTDPDWEPSKSLSDYKRSLEELQVARCIYEWAEHLKAACITLSSAEYLLFSTPRPIEQATRQFTRFDLIRTVADNTSLTLSAGIGYGAAAAEAKSRARKAMVRAIASGGSCAFFLGPDGLIGPVRNKELPDIQSDSTDLLMLSRRTGISFRYLQILADLCRAQHRTCFTPSELADASGIRQRTMNRLLLKLIDAGCCVEKGRHFAHKSGRPSRIVELHLLGKSSFSDIEKASF